MQIWILFLGNIMIGINRYSHPCMPKELHQMYDLMKLQEKQDEKDKKEEANNEIKVEFSNHNVEEINIETNTKMDVTV
ncbi:hypothetical protein [Campylobacter iguaniorum]|uniref:hypothetical protein n=1 Tax=Campylobacter iguaniorum TaxID=1244531 RepID=UPI001F244F59|nr:hypothetical protein [Campylobacter iguaniorum]